MAGSTRHQPRMIALRMTCRSTRLRGWLVFCCACVFGLVPGCGRQEEIRHYKVARAPEPVRRPPESAAPTRMLAAVVPHKDQAWFFKLTGAPAAAAAKSEEFETFLKSITFSDGETAQPKWQLPDGWRDVGASPMRFTTIRLGDGANALELSVSSLPLQAGDIDGYYLLNINRWRDQLGLPPIDRGRLASESSRIELPDDHIAVVVDFEGRMSSSRSGMAPFAGGRANSSSVPNESTAATESGLKYDAPQGWKPGKAGGLRKAAFEVQADGQHVEITVIDLAEAAGEVLPNVNRWRGQVKLGETTDAELKKEAKQIEVDGVEGIYVELIGPESTSPRQTILGVIAIHGGKSWFIKLQGDSELAAREKSHFEEFVKSVKFQ